MELSLPVGGVQLKGNLELSGNKDIRVIFSHGSGSSRHSPRNRYVSDVLNCSGISTLLVDLLTEEEDEIYSNRFDIGLLTNRLAEITGYFRDRHDHPFRQIGYFGASTGAASALNAAAFRKDIFAVVSRGGRPDLSDENLPAVECPVLLIVGGYDHHVIDLNRHAFFRLNCVKKMEIVPGATHLFEEPGTLEQVADLATRWFILHSQTQQAKT